MVVSDDVLLANLTEPQREAVRHVDGPMLVLAGPGSGKTTVVTRRVGHLIALGIPPWQILALTFTNKAAGEMRQRIEPMLPDGLPGRRGLTVATFHAFCVRLLRRYADEAGISPRFSIYDQADQRDAIKRALGEANLSAKNWTPASVGAAISQAKNRLQEADAYAGQASDFYTRCIGKVYRAYEKILAANDALDFDDLLLRVAKLLRAAEPVRRELQERYQYLLIDEYQDTNHAQFVIAHTLAAAHKNIFVVGDPDQSIYGWRGADITNILEFEEHYPKARVVPLGQNFRSTGHIVEAAAGLIRHNRRRKHKNLHTELGPGEHPTVARCSDEHREATLVTDELRRRHEEDGFAWKDMAVLYRINALSRVLEEAFRAAQIPYIIARGTAFYERKEVKDALAYLRVIANPRDDISLRRIINTPARGIGKTTLDQIEIFAIDRQLGLREALGRVDEVEGLSARARTAVKRFAKTLGEWTAPIRVGGGEVGGMLGELVERVVRESGLEAMYQRSKAEEDQERRENLGELISAAAEFVPPEPDRAAGASDDPPDEPSLGAVLDAFLESVALVSDADLIDPSKGVVTLMTLHAAKGLEFAVVVMVGLEEGLLPHRRAAESELELEEERRLCFVGITRAKRHLLLTRAAVRTHRGIRQRTIDSQFLKELPAESVITCDFAGDVDELDDPYSAGDDGRRPTGGGAYADFPVGCLVRHATFGLGRVESITPRANGASARVRFNTVGPKTLILAYARLERVE